MSSSPRTLRPHARGAPPLCMGAHGWRAWSVLSMSRFMSSYVIDPFLMAFPASEKGASPALAPLVAIVYSRALTSSACRRHETRSAHPYPYPGARVAPGDAVREVWRLRLYWHGGDGGDGDGRGDGGGGGGGGSCGRVRGGVEGGSGGEGTRAGMARRRPSLVWPYGDAMERIAVARHRLVPRTFAIMRPVTTSPSCAAAGGGSENNAMGRHRGLRRC